MRKHYEGTIVSLMGSEPQTAVLKVNVIGLATFEIPMEFVNYWVLVEVKN